MRKIYGGLTPHPFSKFVVAPTPAKAGGLSHERPPSRFPAAQRVRVGLGGERDKRAAGMEGVNLNYSDLPYAKSQYHLFYSPINLTYYPTL